MVKGRIRFGFSHRGTYIWRVSGIVQGTGKEECTVSTESHGMVQAEGTHFVYQDGTKYLPFGTTVYALMHQPEKLVRQTLDTLSRAPFNKIRLCVFPKHCDYNNNDPEFYPFERDENGKWNVHRPNMEFWRRFEDTMDEISRMGIQIDLILFHPYDCWGFSTLKIEECKVYLDYLMRRFAAFPYIWWSMANEYDLCFERTMEEWYQIESFIVENDPYGHLLSNHQCMKYYDFSRPAMTHCCVQSVAFQKTEQWHKRFGKPVIFDECCYEGDIEFDWGDISGFEMASRFWKACVNGAYASHGETFYSEDEVLWWAKGGQLKGESPEYAGHCGDDVFLKYYGNRRPTISTICLPEEHRYRVEAIDIWNMTRTVIEEDAHGMTKLRLPGKEGIAVLAISKNV